MLYRIFVPVIAGLLFLGGGATVADAGPPDPGDNLGALTSYEILEEDFDQGAHASDPSDDGVGPEDRVGLANVVERGNLQATVDFLASLLLP